MSRISRDLAFTALFMGVIFGVFLADYFYFPGVILPGPFYGLPVLAAAYFLGFRYVVALAVGAVALHALSLGLQPPTESWITSFVVAGTALIGGLSAALARRRSQEKVLRQRADAAAALAEHRADELDAKNRELAVERERLEAIGHVAEATLSSLPLEAMLDELLVRLRRELAADTATILLLGEDGATLAVRASSGLAEEVQDRVSVPMGQGVAGRIAASRQPLVVDDLSTVVVVSGLLRERVRSLLGAPLLVGDRVIGVIHVGTLAPRRFSAADLQLLQLVADRSASTIERERLLAAERARTAELEAVLDSLSDGLIVYGPEREVVRMNAAAERLLGFSREAWARLSATEQLHSLYPSDARGSPLTADETPVARALRGESVLGFRMTIQRPDGTVRHLLTNTSPIVGDSQPVVGAILSLADITEVLALQEQREDFVRMVSHDLRQPLAVMHGQGQLLLGYLGKQGMDGRTQRSLEAIVTSAGRMGAMIADLVDSARLEAGQVSLQKRMIDVRSLLSGIARRAGSPDEAARIQLEIAEGLPPLSVDLERLERAVGNLLGNALKYSPPDTPVVVAAAPSHDGVEVSVTDRGVGIPSADLPLVFERYYRATTASKREGLGLGLYIARLIVEAHGGCIWVKSEVGVGSTFFMTLPAGESGSPEPPGES